MFSVNASDEEERERGKEEKKKRKQGKKCCNQAESDDEIMYGKQSVNGTTILAASDPFQNAVHLPTLDSTESSLLFLTIFSRPPSLHHHPLLLLVTATAKLFPP